MFCDCLCVQVLSMRLIDFYLESEAMGRLDGPSAIGVATGSLVCIFQTMSEAHCASGASLWSSAIGVATGIVVC